MIFISLAFQGLGFDAPDASSIEEKNALALAIVPSEPGKHFVYDSCLLFCCYACLREVWWVDNAASSAFGSGATQSKDFNPTGWELALVSTPSTNISAANERQLVISVFIFYDSVANEFCEH